MIVNTIKFTYEIIINRLFLFSVEMATLTRVNNKTDINILSNKEVEDLIAEFEKREAAAAEASKKDKPAP